MKSVHKLIIFGLASLALAASAYAQSPREQLQQMVEQLQKAPNDNALREKIIKLGAEIKPAPAIPEEAERRMARGEAAFETAKTPGDFENAVAEFSAAVEAAPWFASGYYNMGLAQEKAEMPEAAIKSFKFYLSAASPSNDAGEVKKRIYKLEYASEQNKPEVAAARAQAAFEAALPKLNGARYKTREHEPGYWQEALIDGRTLLVWTVRDSRHSEYRLNGPRTGPQRFQLINPEILFGNFYCPGKADCPGTLFVHPDGSRLTVNRPVAAGGPYDFVRQ